MRVAGKSMSLVMTIGALIACGVFLFGGITLHKTTLQQNKTYTGSCEAEVVDYEVRQEEQTVTDANGNDTTEIIDMYYPIFKYTVDGEEYQTLYESGSSEKAYEENSTVTIHYLPSDPTQFYVAGDVFRTYAPYALYLASLVMAAMAVIMLIRTARR